MERLTTPEWDSIYSRVKTEFDAMVAKLEADYKERYGTAWASAMVGALEYKLFESLVNAECKRVLLDRADKKYDDLLEHEWGSGKSL
jgi:hypothetical protein